MGETISYGVSPHTLDPKPYTKQAAGIFHRVTDYVCYCAATDKNRQMLLEGKSMFICYRKVVQVF